MSWGLCTCVFLQLAEREAEHHAELAQVRLTVSREVEGAYLRCLEKMVDHDSPSGEGAPGSAIKKPTTALKKPARRASEERYQSTKQPRKTTK